jgi:hypothetical protein
MMGPAPYHVVEVYLTDDDFIRFHSMTANYYKLQFVYTPFLMQGQKFSSTMGQNGPTKSTVEIVKIDLTLIIDHAP